MYVIIQPEILSNQTIFGIISLLITGLLKIKITIPKQAIDKVGIVIINNAVSDGDMSALKNCNMKDVMPMIVNGSERSVKMPVITCFLNKRGIFAEEECSSYPLSFEALRTMLTPM